MTEMMHQDVDPQETQEWLGSLESVLEEEGVEDIQALQAPFKLLINQYT